MTEEDKRPLETPKKQKRPYASAALLIIITALYVAISTGVIAYGVQGLKETVPDEGVLVDGVREFRITAQQWYFGPGLLKANPGETIKFIVNSGDITHGFAINELGINLSLTPSSTVKREVIIPADISDGTYTLYCSIFCGIGHPYMKGGIIVGEPGVGLGRILPYAATFIMAGIFGAFVIVGRRRAR